MKNYGITLIGGNYATLGPQKDLSSSLRLVCYEISDLFFIKEAFLYTNDSSTERLFLGILMSCLILKFYRALNLCYASKTI